MITTPANSKNFTILYVEDETIIRKNVENCLSYIFNVLVAKDGEEGLDLFEHNKIDLVITDINMPLKDGIEMLEDIKEVNPNVPCIVTSAFDIEVINKLDPGINCQYMVKPFDVKELLNNSLKVLKLI